MKKLSLIITVVFIAVMVINLRVENKSPNMSNLALSNIHLLTANAESPGGTGCRSGCQDAKPFDYCFKCDPCQGSFGKIGIGDAWTCS